MYRGRTGGVAFGRRFFGDSRARCFKCNGLGPMRDAFHRVRTGSGARVDEERPLRTSDLQYCALPTRTPENRAAPKPRRVSSVTASPRFTSRGDRDDTTSSHRRTASSRALENRARVRQTRPKTSARGNQKFSERRRLRARAGQRWSGGRLGGRARPSTLRAPIAVPMVRPCPFGCQNRSLRWL